LKHAAAAPALAAIASDAVQPHALRVQAIRALAAIGDAASPATLMKIVTAPKIDAVLQMEAVVALGQLRSPAAVDVLLDTASAPWPTLRGASLVALARIDPDVFISVIAGLDNDPEWSVRAALASALAELPERRGEARLAELLADDDQRALPAVLTALAATGASSATSVLSAPYSRRPRRPHGRSQRSRPAQGHDQVPALVAALERSAGDGTYVARGLLSASRLDPVAATPRLTGALSDADWAIRVRAAELLRGLDASAALGPATPAPPPAVPELSAIQALLTPAFTPTAYIDTEKGLIQFELAVVDAPRTVANFTALARKGFFNNVPWHRVVADFVVQGGDPAAMAKAGQAIPFATRSISVPTCVAPWAWRSTGRIPAAASSSSRTRRSRTSTGATRCSGRSWRGWTWSMRYGSGTWCAAFASGTESPGSVATRRNKKGGAPSAPFFRSLAEA
jgi:HEAT repeat protein